MMTIQLARRIIARGFVAITLAAFCTTTVLGQTKIATVDLRKAFDGYFKTQQASDQLQQRKDDAEQTLKGMLDDHQKGLEEYKKLSGSAADPTLSSDERDKRKKSAEAKLIELQEIERSIKLYRENSLKTLDDHRQRMRENVLKVVREAIVMKAKAGAYNLVLDSSANSADRTDVILFAAGLPDLTDEVLREINATAPPGWTPKPADANSN